MSRSACFLAQERRSDRGDGRLNERNRKKNLSKKQNKKQIRMNLVTKTYL